MVYVNAGCKNEMLKHILSFRRTIYYEPSEERNKIPSKINVVYENEEYNIFLTTDESITCFFCKEHGHIQRNCQNPPKLNYSLLNTIEKSTFDVNETQENNPKRKRGPHFTLTNESTEINPNFALSNIEMINNLKKM